jgi:hypothetical protein
MASKGVAERAGELRLKPFHGVEGLGAGDEIRNDSGSGIYFWSPFELVCGRRFFTAGCVLL